MDTAAVKPNRSYRPGLLEALVSLCILVKLAGVVVPITADRADAMRMERTETALSDIARGLQAYTRDTGLLPVGGEELTVTWLYGPGDMPRNHPFGSELEARPLADALLTSSMTGDGWRGPYIAQLGPDPWGRAYLVNVDGLVDVRESAMVLSAGANGIVETAAGSVRPGGDDLIQMLD
jgi:type II secretory pathway pseudopilin PulG